MADADIAGNGSVWIGLEDDYGTPVDPSAAGVGVWCPIISESLKYTEDTYYSPQIRQSAIVSDAKQSYYHVEGDIVMEVDAHYLPYFMIASRHTTALAAGVYSSTPTNIGAAYPGGTGRGLSIATIRNSVGFLYSGCVVNTWEFTIDNGILRVSMGMLGLAENDLAGAVTQAWIDPSLFGADAHSIYIDAAGTAPGFAGARDRTFNGFTWRTNYNATPQNRIVPERSATFVAYGETEATYETEVDFVDKTEYNNMKNLGFRAIRLESLKPGGTAGTFAAATEAVRITTYRSNYDDFEVGLSGMGDLLMGRVTGRSIGIAGGVPYKIECKSTATVTP